MCADSGCRIDDEGIGGNTAPQPVFDFECAFSVIGVQQYQSIQWRLGLREFDQFIDSTGKGTYPTNRLDFALVDAEDRLDLQELSDTSRRPSDPPAAAQIFDGFSGSVQFFVISRPLNSIQYRA